jgi:hypothetical protein
MPIDPSIALQVQGAPDNSGKLMQFAQMQQMGQQRQQQADQQAAALREHKRIKAMTERGTGLFMRYQTLKDNGFSEQAAHAAMQEDWQRDIGGLASLRDDNGQALFSQEELGQFGQEFNAGQLGQILPQLMGADKAMDAYFKTRETKDDRTTEQKNYAASKDDPGFAKFMETNNRSKAPQVNVNTGQMPLTKPNVNDAQKSVVFATEQLGNLDAIAKEYETGFLTYGGKVKNFVDRQTDKIDPTSLSRDDRAALGKQTRFKQQVNRGFNAYRKEITGAAAALAELEQLKQAMLNTDLGPTEFKAAFDSYQSELKRSLRLKRKMLREGINVADEGFGARYDQAFASGTDDDPVARGEELEAGGTADDEIVKTLRAEGYID